MINLFNFAGLDLVSAAYALEALVAFAVVGWLISLAKKDVSIVDSMWSLMFLLSLFVYVFLTGSGGARTWLVAALVAVWAVRLSTYITWRGLGEPEDRRYQAIRDRNEPDFRLKSLYLVFGLQALLAWLISFPLLAAVQGGAPLGLLDLAGGVLWLAGMMFETVGDAQLARFKKDPANQGKVLQSGLWRYTRHPNYFGEFLIHWGFWMLAIPAGGAWTLFAPLLMSYLLLRVSGVALLEKDITSRRPEYRAYVRSTNAFFPGPPDESAGRGVSGHEA